MSFRYKTILGIAVIEAMLLAILIGSSLRFLQVSNEEELIKRASTTATLFATTTKDAVLATDLASLESFVAEVLKNPGLVYARVLSATDGVLAQGGRAEALRRPFAPDRAFDGVADGVFDTYAEISEAGVNYGRVEIGLSVDQLTGLLNRARERAVTIAAFEMVLTGLFSLALGVYLTRQLSSLKEAAQRLAAGDLGYQIMVRGRDELAQTAEAFNEMSRKLKHSLNRRKEAEDELQRLNDDLERRVTMRTKKIVAVNKQLEYRALHDSLTKLPNRLLFCDRLGQAILMAQRAKAQIAVAVIDLDGFKQINDTLGHHVGDLVLQQFAFRIRDLLRESDTVARLGGDEFALLLPTVVDRATALGAVRKILDAVRAPTVIAGESYDVRASIGVALFPDDGDGPDTLLAHADAAMYSAKRGKNGVAEYDPDLDTQGRERQALATDLRRAIEREEFVLHYQPKIDFRTNLLSGVTALARWNSPSLGLVMPDKFVPLAEEIGLGKALTMCVIRQALRQCAEWHRAGTGLPVAVTVSASNLQDAEFPEQVRKAIEQTDAPAGMLDMAVTEIAIMMDPIRAMEVATQLHAMGITLSVSDFGSGYASLAYLNKFMLAKIKIDRSVILGMLDNEDNSAVVSATIGLAHSLGLKVVAEGVESEALWDQLKTLGCDSAVGYYLSKPIPGAAVLDWVRQASRSVAGTAAG